jgi:HSP20 family protein
MVTLMEPEKNIYPGIYRPSGEFTRVVVNCAKDIEDINELASFNLQESQDHYIIEASLPDVPRENISVQVHDEIISVVVKDAADHIPSLHLNKIDPSGCAYHSFRMPTHIETGFISAAYRKGLLKIYIPKAKKRVEIKDQDVVIY